MAKIAYGERAGIQNAINTGVIPKDTVIITKDNIDSELLFYDNEGKLSGVSEKTRFTTMTEAIAWVRKYPCTGRIVTIHNGSDWLPYVVDDNNNLIPINESIVSDVTDIKIIDGNTPIVY